MGPGSVLESQEDSAVLDLFLRNRGPQFGGKAGIPCLTILSAQSLPALRFLLSTPGGSEDEELLALEPLTVGHPWTETILHSFVGGTDGQNPSGSVIFDAVGNLYGTTYGGGTFGFDWSFYRL